MLWQVNSWGKISKSAWNAKTSMLWILQEIETSLASCADMQPILHLDRCSVLIQKGVSAKSTATASWVNVALPTCRCLLCSAMKQPLSRALLSQIRRTFSDLGFGA